jgi:hypothetical protein
VFPAYRALPANCPNNGLFQRLLSLVVASLQECPGTQEGEYHKPTTSKIYCGHLDRPQRKLCADSRLHSAPGFSCLGDEMANDFVLQWASKTIAKPIAIAFTNSVICVAVDLPDSTSIGILRVRSGLRMRTLLWQLQHSWLYRLTREQPS